MFQVILKNKQTNKTSYEIRLQAQSYVQSYGYSVGLKETIVDKYKNCKEDM